MFYCIFLSKLRKTEEKNGKKQKNFSGYLPLFGYYLKKMVDVKSNGCASDICPNKDLFHDPPDVIITSGIAVSEVEIPNHNDDILL